MFWKKKNNNIENNETNEDNKSVVFIQPTKEVINGTIVKWEKLRNVGKQYKQAKKEYGENAHINIKLEKTEHPVISVNEFIIDNRLNNAVITKKLALGKELDNPTGRMLLEPENIETPTFAYDVCFHVYKETVADYEEDFPDDLMEVIDDAMEWCQYAGVATAILWKENQMPFKFKEAYSVITNGKGLDEIIDNIERIKENDPLFKWTKYSTSFKEIRSIIEEPLYRCENNEIMKMQIIDCMMAAFIWSVEMEI